MTKRPDMDSRWPGSRHARRGSGLSPVGRSVQSVARAIATTGPQGLEVAWAAAVGAGIARRSRPVFLDGHKLVVAVPDAAWQWEVQGMTRRIVGRLRNVLGAAAPRRLEIVVDSGMVVPEIAPEPVEAAVESADPLAPAPGAEAIADPQLRAAFERAHAAQVRRLGSGDA